MLLKKPWERRLKDLSMLLHNCAATYFEPELFRMNTNQFLQTSRTVTFIIQKNKANIRDYESWYKDNVLERWANDELMQWAKNSRNVIEKEGDLEIFSSLSTTLLFSYLEEEDIKIECGRSILIGYGVKKLVRLAQKKLPSGVSDAAVVKIERKWVASSLASWELLHALSYIYFRVYECCHLLGKHLDSPLDNSIPNKGSVDLSREKSRKVEYVKIRGLKKCHLASEITRFSSKSELPDNVKKIIGELSESSPSKNTLSGMVQFYAGIAEVTFNSYGNHVPMLFMLNENWQILDFVTVAFEDQADKFIFWRVISERVASQKAHALIWISESWVRTAKQNMHIPVRKMPVIGEKLHVLGIDKYNCRDSIAWNIIRNDVNDKPRLEIISDSENNSYEGVPYYFVPALRKMGLSDKEIFKNEKFS